MNARWFNLLRFALLTLTIGATLTLFVFGDFAARRYLYPTRRALTLADSPAAFGSDYRSLCLRTADGVTLSAWYALPQNGAAILLAHGFGGHRSAEKFAMFTRNGYGVLTWDARAHGESSRRFASLGYHETRDAQAALNFLLTQPEITHIGALGESMGGVTLIRFAATTPHIEALVTDSAFADIQDMLDKIAPPVLQPFIRFSVFWRTNGLSLHRLRPIDQISTISPRPLLIIQGDADALVPPDSAPRLYAAALPPKTLWVAPGAAHVAAFKIYPAEYEQRVITFFNQTFFPTGTP